MRLVIMMSMINPFNKQIAMADLVALILVSVLFVAHLVIVSLLPDTIPRHISLDGTATGEVSRFDWRTFLLPLLGITVVPLLTVFKYIYCQDGRPPYGRHISTTSVSFAAMMWIGWIITMAYIINYSGINTDILENLLIIPGTLSLILIVGGFVMQFVGPNILIGFRTSKTMSNGELWKRTNVISGILLMIAGVIILVISLYIDSGSTRKTVAIGIALAAVLFSTLIYIMERRKLDIAESI